MKPFRILCAAVLATAVTALAAGSAGAITPANGGDPGGTLWAVNNGPGDQTEPHVSGDLVVYTNNNEPSSTIHYLDFATAATGVVPAGAFADNDFLPDVAGNRIVFSRSRSDGQTAAMLFDVGSGVVRELDPQPAVTRFGAVIGGDTVAYADFAVDVNGEVFAYDLTTATATNLSQSSGFDGAPAVSPAGNVVVWQRCVQFEVDCDVFQAVRNGGVWGAPTPVAASLWNDSNADTDGTTVVYDSDRPSATVQDIYLKPVAGGPEVPLQLGGFESNPSISRGVVTFESSSVFGGTSDLWAYVKATNTLYRVTDTPTVSETLNDVSVLPSGAVRVVWAANDDAVAGFHNVYSRTFTVPLTPSTFSGFFSPVDNPPVFNVVRGGQAIPVKFSLGGNQGLDIFAAAYPVSQQIACDNSSLLDDVEQTVTAGSSSLSYDATTDAYTYVWKTDKTWAQTCRQLIVRLADGTDHIAYFKFK